jgi:hypothetical protein
VVANSQAVRPSHLTHSQPNNTYAANGASGLSNRYGSAQPGSNMLLSSSVGVNNGVTGQSHSLSLNVNNSPAVNLIALQMLKNAQSAYHKH